MMSHIQAYNMFFLLCFRWFMISSRCQVNGTMVDSKVLNVGVGLWDETLPLKMGSQLYEIRGLKASSWYEVKISYPASVPSSFSIQLKRGISNKFDSNRRLLNTEKLIFKAAGNNLGGTYVLVSVEPAGVVAIPYAAERKSVIFNIVCDELLFGIPPKARWVGGVVLLCLVLSFLAPYYLPLRLLQKNQRSICAANSTVSKDS